MGQKSMSWFLFSPKQIVLYMRGYQITLLSNLQQTVQYKVGIFSTSNYISEWNTQFNR